MAAGIIEKIAALRERRVDTFGASGHKFELAPPLTEAEVVALEEQHGVTLPEAYRWFLTNVAASGAGPYYGIVPPARWGHALYGDVAMPDFAARPCVWTPEGGSRDGLDEPYQGAIVLADQGCAYYATLVVTGAARGRVMYVSLDGGKPSFPEDKDFLAWYERWADELLAGFKHFWFGTQMPGDEASFRAAARGPRRKDALHAMTQLPSLSDATRAEVALRMRDEDPEVRRAALYLVKQFSLIDTVDVHVRRALRDPDPEVRIAALQAVPGAARELLADPDEKVVVRALRDLDATEADIFPLLDSPSQAIREAAHYTGRKVPSLAIFDATLDDLRNRGELPYDGMLHTLLAQVRHGVVDEARRRIVLELIRERIATEHVTAAIYGLAALKLPEAFALLLELTTHAEPFTRFDAAAVLGDIGDRAALPALHELVADDAMPRLESRSTAWSVGENARRAIAKIEKK